MSKPQRNPSGEDQAKKKRNYKLLVDPELRRDATKKIYRFDGCVPGESPIPTPRDPRVQKTILGGIGKIWDIPVPRFKYDKFSVCQPPLWQVFVTGLSPNITSTLLKGTFSQVGPTTFVKIHRHPNGGASLGAASVCFKQKGDGTVAVETLNGFQLYGCTLSVQLDDQGEKARQFLREKLDPSKEGSKKKPTSLPVLASDNSDKMSDSGNSSEPSSGWLATPQSDDLRERSNSLTSPVTPSSAGLSSSSKTFQHFPHDPRVPSSQTLISPTVQNTQSLVSPTSSQRDTPSSLDSGILVATRHETKTSEVLLPKVQKQPLMLSSLLVSSSLQMEHRSPLSLGGNEREHPSCQGYGSKTPQPLSSDHPKPLVNKTKTTSAVKMPPKTEAHSSPVVAALSPISDISDTKSESPGMVDNTHRDGKFVNTFQLNATASSGYSLATFDPSVSLQALMVLKKVMMQKPEQMEIEDISGDESPEVVVNDNVATKPPEGDTCEDMEVSDMECDSPTDAKIEVASTVPVTSCVSPASFPTPLMGFEVNSYRGYPPLLPPPVPPPMGTFPNSAHPIGTFPQPPHFLFPIPPPGHPPPPFLPPLAPIPPPLSVVQDHSHHTPKPTVEVSTASRREQRLKKENLSKELKEKILSQLKEVLLKDLQKKYINTVGMELAERHWESLQRDQKSSEKPSTNSLASSDEPYRRMLDSKAKGLLSQDGHLSLPGGKRNRFVNFKIPTISRGGSRRSDGVITMRRAAKTRQEHVLSPLYSDFSSSESESEKAIEKDKIKQDREEEEEQKEIEGDEDEVELDEETDEELKGVESEGEYYVSQPGEDELSSASDFSSFDEDEEEEAEEDDRGVESDVSSAVSKDKEPLTAPVPERTAKILDVSSGSEDGVAVDFESSVLDTAKVEENSLVQPMSTPPEELTVPSPPREKLASPPPIASPVFGKRSQSENERILSTFLEMGPDQEDVEMFRSAWLRMREEGNSLMKGLFWAHYPSMIADPIMAPPPPKRRRHTPQRLSELSHKSGAARSEGYYKIDAFAKKDYVTTTVVDTPAPAKSQKQQKEGNKTSGRVNRAKQRRLASDFASAEISSDLIKYGHLKARKKMVRFARSSIHGWGLFALEKIPADEMVIEYVGEIIRSNTADEREHRYEAMGIGSSYLFRLDGESVIDATKRGGVARFINHCCDPNCYAKVIVIGSLKKIVIYSKRDIHANEEITYDYKFPIEDEKIPCLCGAPQCRGTLN